MQQKCKVTVIDKKCFNDYQEKYLADPKSGSCPLYLHCASGRQHYARLD